MSLRRLYLLPAVLLAVSLPLSAATPTAGERAPDFTLSTIDGTNVSLSGLARNGRVAVVLLRGYPGYQCPFAQQQFQSFTQAATQFATLSTEVLFVYPGNGGKDLAANAWAMLGGQTLPANVHLVLDPDYVFATKYGLRWDAEGQTVYPSTFLIHPDRTVFFAHTGQSQSDLTQSADALAVIAADTDAPKPAD
jgi:peroxiredoxin